MPDSFRAVPAILTTTDTSPHGLNAGPKMPLTVQPTFLCLGVQKAGTSWLYQMVRQHPEICLSEPKELHFFNRSPNFRKGLDWYLSHFRCSDATRAVGEFTPDYLWGQDDRWLPGERCIANVPERVAAHFPDLRFIVVLRNPVSRAASSYYHHIGAGRLSSRARLSDVDDFWGLLSMGHYAEHLERWFTYFSRDRFLVFVFEEDFSPIQQPSSFGAIFRHLGVSPDFVPEGTAKRYNKRRSHFDYRLSRLPGPLRRFMRHVTPEFIEQRELWNISVTGAELAALKDYYRSHNERLAILLEKTLPW